MRCNDCGEAIPERNRFEVHGRPDVCDGCWENRMALVRGEICKPGGPEFKAIQKALAGGSGTAKRRIEAARLRNQ